jgi:hypothetical protein
MGKLRMTLILEYEVNPADYGVTTMEEAAAEDRAAFDNDPIGTLANLGDEATNEIFTVEVI